MNRLKRILSSKNNGGFTLIEVIVSCALLGILLVGIIMFTQPLLQNVNDTNTSTRANNLATTVEYYISRSIRNAAYLAIFNEASFNDTLTNGTVTTTAQEMSNFVKSNSNYQLKCISIRYGYDERSQTNKYYICNEKVDMTSGYHLDSANSNSNALSDDCLAFDKCYFDGVYMGVSVEQETAKDDATELIPAVRVDIRVFDDAAMGDESMIFFGQGYTTLRNVELAQNDASLNQKFKIYPTQNLGTGNETYIYYVERKLA